MGFRLVPKLMTLNDLEQHNGHCQTRAEMTQGGKLENVKFSFASISIKPFPFPFPRN